MALMSGTVTNAFDLGERIIDLLEEIRDAQGEGEVQREEFMVLPFSFDIAGGTGQVDIRIPAGMGILLSSVAVQATGAGGRLSVYAGAVQPSSLLMTVDGPAALTAATARMSKVFGPNDYVPENTTLTVVAEGIGAPDGRAAGVFRGKMFTRSERARPTTHSDG